MVEVVALVAEHGAFAQHLESVGEPPGYEELAHVLRREDHAEPFPVRRAPDSQIDRHIVHLALDHAHELGLRVGDLVMEPAEDALRRL